MCRDGPIDPGIEETRMSAMKRAPRSQPGERTDASPPPITYRAVELPSGDAPCPASWRARFGHCLAEEPRPGSLLFQAGCFLPAESGAPGGAAGEEKL